MNFNPHGRGHAPRTRPVCVSAAGTSHIGLLTLRNRSQPLIAKAVMFKSPQTRVAIVLAWAAHCSLALAAPMDVQDAAPAPSSSVATPAAGQAQPGATVPGLGGTPNSGSSIDLLLQMQNLPAASAPVSQPRVDAAIRREPVGELPAAGEGSLLDDVLSGAGRLKSAVLGDHQPEIDSGRRIDADEELRPRESASGMPANSPSAQQGQAPSTWLLNNPAVRFIRENRSLTIAVGLGLLAAAWLGSMWPAWQRQREARRRHR